MIDIQKPARRSASIRRVTAETDINLELCLDGSGKTLIETPIPFLSHLLEAFARHGNLDIELRASGDIEVDQHHTVEDIGLVLGQAISRALGERLGINRMGDALVPMDDALARAAVDLSGRPYAVVQAEFAREKQGDLEVDLVPEFFRALAQGCGANWHVAVIYGENEHHKLEALFKSAGRALREAVIVDPRRDGQTPSTKGLIDA